MALSIHRILKPFGRVAYKNPTTAMIDRELAAFLEEGLDLHLGTRDARLAPAGARVTAVLADPDGLHVTAFVPAVAAARAMADLLDNGQAALVGVRPLDDRGCQLKGVVVETRPATEEERVAILAQWERAREILERIGVPRALSESWIVWPSMALRLRVTALFNQTPGPGAGAPLT